MWMARLAEWPKPVQELRDSDPLFDDFDAVAEARRADDARLSTWAEALDEEALSGRLTWNSGAVGRKIGAPRTLLVVHRFNHQTHHRGQVHAMLTAAGERTGDTDFSFVLPMPG